MRKLFLGLGILGLLLQEPAVGKELQTNATYMAETPDWVTKTRIDRVVDRIQMFLEWSIRRVNVTWYHDQAAFERVHGLGSAVLAISRKADNSIHLGPRVTTKNFDQVFGHELAHIISFQKYKEAIPKWLEEGLANHVAKAAQVDYTWLASRPMPVDVRNLIHPFGKTVEDARYHYMASQALIEMIAAKCDLKNLLRLSVGMNMDNYLDTYCKMTDLNAFFRKWVKEKTPGFKKPA